LFGRIFCAKLSLLYLAAAAIAADDGCLLHYIHFFLLLLKAQTTAMNVLKLRALRKATTLSHLQSINKFAFVQLKLDVASFKLE